MSSKYKLNLSRFSNETIKLIENIRNSQPSRNVRSRAKNASGFYSSKKMGLTIQFESHTLELAAIYEKEFDSNVLEYYDQPPSFKINYKKKGRGIGHFYTPDFFVIEKDWVGWEEWKYEEELVKLHKNSPERYFQEENGKWRCPPAEEYAKHKGLNFRVRSSKTLNWNLQNNLRFLEDYFLEENLTVKEETIDLILTLIKNKPAITLKELLCQQSSVLSADDIYSLIVTGKIYANLKTNLITETENFQLFIDKFTGDLYENIATNNSKQYYQDHAPNTFNLEIGNDIQWGTNVCKIINVDEKFVWLLFNHNETTKLPIKTFEVLVQEGAIKSLKDTITNKKVNKQEEKILDILKNTSSDQLEKANEKYLIVKQILEGTSPAEFEKSDRTIRHWMAKYRNAEKVYGNGYIGLLPSTSKQGNRKRKILPEVIELIRQVINDDFETIKQKNYMTSYRYFKTKCFEKGYDTVSYKTFISEVKKRPIHEQTRKRKGVKAAYSTEEFVFYLGQTTPKHGSRPFEICHLDHTELDIELVCSVTGKKLGRPWLTLLVDAFSRRILSFYLTYDPPSYRSCMMTMRECVRKHRRFPKMIVVDGGKEFQSVYFDTLLAFNKSGKKVRPGGKPRYGSVCERLFGTTNTLFIHNLLGNTQITKHVRQVTQEVNPKNHAVWTLELLYENLNDWFYEIYDQRDHSSLDKTPRLTFLESQKVTGQREITLIKYDQTFRMLSLPSTRKGHAKFQPGVGFKINRFNYFAEALRSYPHLENKQIQVKFDPYNLGVAYAFLDKKWVTLTSEYYSVLAGKTEKQLKIATNEILKRNKISGKETDVTSKQLADFLSKAEECELLLLQQLKDSATKNILHVIDGGRATKNIEEQQKPDKNFVNSTVLDFPARKANPENEEAQNNYGEDLVLYEEF
jgi:putative transposase